MQVYTFTTAKFQPLVGAGPGGNPSEGQRLIQACLVSHLSLTARALKTVNKNGAYSVLKTAGLI